jgi:tRNA pseudouridine38-40 synthase
MVRRIKLTLGYRGTRFAGWARQADGGTAGRPTIQGEVERALATVLGVPIPITAAGRTDAGVHAERQVVSFDITGALPASALVRLLPRHLPDDVWVVEATDAPSSFDARRSAWRRWYRYFLWCQPTPLPGIWRGRCLEHPEPLDIPAMRQAASHLVGRIDAAALVTGWGRDGRPGRSTWRTIERADFYESACPDTPFYFEIGADAFLKQMVRTIMGGLLWVGRGHWSAADFADALASGDRRRSGPTAPAHGLTLWTIEYPHSAEASS